MSKRYLVRTLPTADADVPIHDVKPDLVSAKLDRLKKNVSAIYDRSPKRKALR